MSTNKWSNNPKCPVHKSLENLLVLSNYLTRTKIHPRIVAKMRRPTRSVFLANFVLGRKKNKVDFNFDFTASKYISSSSRSDGSFANSSLEGSNELNVFFIWEESKYIIWGFFVTWVCRELKAFWELFSPEASWKKLPSWFF